MLWSRGEATSEGDGGDKVNNDAEGRASFSTGGSINGVNPGVESAETKQKSYWSLQGREITIINQKNNCLIILQANPSLQPNSHLLPVRQYKLLVSRMFLEQKSSRSISLNHKTS